MKWKNLKRFSPLFGLAIFLLALWALNRALSEYRFGDIVNQLAHFPPGRILKAGALTILTYLTLTCYDRLGMRYLGHSLTPERITLASFTSYAFSRNIGFSLLTGGSVRYRIYSSWGLSAEEIARLTTFAALAFILGMASIGGGILLLSAGIPPLPHVPPCYFQPAGAIALAVVAGYLLLLSFRRRALRLRDWQLPLPTLRQGIGQLLVGSADWLLTAIVLYVLLPPAPDLSLPRFLQIYLLAQVAVIFSHVPGGLGVFESIFLLLLPGLPPPALFSSLLVYRVIYFLLPFAMGIVLLGTFEALQHRHRVRRARAAIERYLSAFAPLLLATAALIAGAALLFSAAIPSYSGRLLRLASFLPLPVLEIAHFLSALAGAGLLLLAPGLQHRLRSAFRLACAMLASGILLSLLKGLEVETAAVLALVLAALLAGRDHFDRHCPLLEERFPVGWLAALCIVFCTSIWLGIFSNRHFDLPSMWLTFGLHASAPRFLRAMAGVALVFLLFLLARWRNRAAPRPPAAHDVERAARILAKQGAPPYPVLSADPTLFFNRDGTAFLLYGIAGRSWIAMGDPVGDTAQRREIAWQFREAGECAGYRSVFFALGEEDLPVYLEMGMGLLPLGREARISLAGSSPAEELAGDYRQLVDQGYVFEVCPAAEAARLRLEIRRICEEDPRRRRSIPCGERLAGQASRLPLAVVRHGGQILALAGFRSGMEGRELTVDFLRLTAGAPPGIAEFLFFALARWGKQEDFRWFNLGTGPLAAGRDDPLAAVRQGLGLRLFRLGEPFASPEELRAFQESFHPHWNLRYLACPEGIDLPEIFRDIAVLLDGEEEKSS